MTPLAGLLNLIATVALYIPQATAALLNSKDEAVGSTAKILSNVVRRYIAPTREPCDKEKEILVKECLNLVEVISITVPVESCQQ